MPDSLFGPPIIRAKTMQEKLADWFTGRKYDEDPNPLSFLAALVAPLLSLGGPGNKAAMLPNLPVDRNLRNAMDYLGTIKTKGKDLRLKGDWGENIEILEAFDELVNPLMERPKERLILRRINPDLVEPSQPTVRREGVMDYVQQAGNSGEFVNRYMEHAPGTYNPILYKTRNRFIASDGHHRSSANLLLNKPSLSQIVDMDATLKDWLQNNDPGNVSYRMLDQLLKRFHGER